MNEDSSEPILQEPAHQRELRELRAVLEASLSLQGELSLDLVLQNIVDQATELVGARYGALSVIDDRGAIERFITCGIDGATRERIGPPPKGAGLLAVPLLEGEALRLEDLGRDPRSTGFPDNHPPMKSLLAVPIVCRTPHQGNLYLAEKEPGGKFSDQDQATLVRFAQGAAAAIDTAHLHLRSESLAIAEERLRLSREIHDGVAQVLAYVNTKAQAAREFLSRGKPDSAIEQLDELAAAARGVYSDVRDGILALRLQPGPERSIEEALGDYVEHWQRRGPTTALLVIEGELRLDTEVQLQIVRIVQEALANVRKHARARTVEIRLVRTREELTASIVDDGVGFDPQLPDSDGARRFGLSVMRERAEGIGGHLELDSAPGRGTRVLVTLPTATLQPLEDSGGTPDANPDS